MVIHQNEQHNEEMMDAQKAVVEIFSHLSRRESPNNKQYAEHRPPGKSDWCQEYQTESVLLGVQTAMIN